MPDLQDTLFTEYPELRDIDDRTIADFEELLNLGSETWEINLGGYTFVYGALFEFEERLAFKNTANFDALTRLRLLKIEYLVDSIIAIKTPMVLHMTFSIENKNCSYVQYYFHFVQE